jgi:hypothetical protein
MKKWLDFRVPPKSCILVSSRSASLWISTLDESMDRDTTTSSGCSCSEWDEEEECSSASSTVSRPSIHRIIGIHIT